MIFAGIDVNIITHPKALAAGVEALGLWTWGMCYAQLHETNGHLPRVSILAALGGRRNIMLAKRLVDAGLWVARDDGSYSIYNYIEKNQTAEEIRAKKAAAAERLRLWRERKKAEEEAHRNANETRFNRASETVSNAVRTLPPPEPSPEPSPSPENKRERGAPGLDLDSPLPDRWRDDARAQIEPTGETVDIDEQWRLYLADRLRPESLKRIGPADWRGWVIRGIGFARKTRQNTRAGPVPRQQLGAAATAEWMNPKQFDFGETK